MSEKKKQSRTYLELQIQLLELENKKLRLIAQRYKLKHGNDMHDEALSKSQEAECLDSGIIFNDLGKPTLLWVTT